MGYCEDSEPATGPSWGDEAISLLRAMGASSRNRRDPAILDPAGDRA
jgi:hypothetical protein